MAADDAVAKIAPPSPSRKWDVPPLPHSPRDFFFSFGNENIPAASLQTVKLTNRKTKSREN